MRLDSQQYEQVLGVLRTRVPPSGSEKRRTARVELNSQLIVMPIRDGKCPEQVSVLTRDISMEGIGLLTTAPLRKGQKFVTLLPRTATETVFVLTEAMYCGVVANGMFTIGCRFVKVLPAKSAESLQPISTQEVERVRRSVLS